MSVRRSVAWAYVGQLFSFAANFASSVITARLLSPHELGIYAIASAAVGVIQIITAFGVAAYVIREPDLTPGTLDTAFTINALLGLGLSMVLLIVSFAAGPLLGDPAAADVLRVICLLPLIAIFGFRPGAMLQREMKFKALAFVSSLGVVVNGAVTVLSALLGASYMSPAYGGLAAGIVGLVITVIAAPQHVRTGVSLAGWRKITTFGLRIMSISGVSVMATRLGEVILGRVLGLAALGLYSRASNLSNIIFTNIYGTATRVVFAQLAKEFRETGELRETFLRGFSIITAFMWPLLLGLAVLSRPVIHLLYGERWLSAAAPLSLLMVAQFLALCFGMNWELFVLRDETARQTRLEVTRSLIGLCFMIIGCQFSLVAAAFGRVMDSLFGLVVYLPHVNRLAETRPGELFKIYAENFALTAAGVGPALVLMITTHWSATTSWLLIAPAIGFGITLWLLLMAFFGHPLFLEMRVWLRKGTAHLRSWG